MGRSIRSFRQLIEIEKLVWSEFKKELKKKNDKKAFDRLFDNAKLYTSYLSFANRPLPIESIISGMIFHHYKTLVSIAKSYTNDERVIGKEIVTSEIYKSYSKDLFDKTCDKWRGLINALHQDDREVLLSILVNGCDSLSEGAAKSIIEKDKPSVSIYFFLYLILQNQRLIERIINSVSENEKTECKLTDFSN